LDFFCSNQANTPPLSLIVKIDVEGSEWAGEISPTFAGFPPLLFSFSPLLFSFSFSRELYSSQRHFHPRLGRATVFVSFFDHTQAPTRCAPIEGLFYLQRTLRIFLLFLLNAILSLSLSKRALPNGAIVVRRARVGGLAAI
jgi:hypothetical protein